ncbi:MAG: peptide ABC transporter substrate-binding protein [bacterium]|nr:peptide ABC transporter substrate-binding protein [bacterium]
MKIFQIYYNFSRIERQLFLGSVIVFAAASIFWASSYFYRNTTAIPVASNQYTEGIVGQPVFINPVLAGNNDADRDLSEILFSNLLALTDRYTVSPDGKTWNIILKTDLLWDDGKPLTSDDIIFTIDSIQNPESRSPLFLTWQGVIADRISELEIEFTLRTPYAFFLDNLKSLKIIPKHIFGIIPTANFRLSDYNLEPVGSGPYKFVSFQKKKDGFITEYNFEANKNYVSTKPFIQKLNIKFFSDTEELLKAFNTKRIDGFGDLSPKNIEDIKLNHQIIEINIPRYYAIFFNPNSNEVLKSQAVKSALTLATNKNRIAETALDNKALIVDQPLLPFLPDFQASSAGQKEFNLDKANELLDKDQWIKDSEGIREKKSGKAVLRLEFDLIVPQIPFLMETADIIKEDWQSIGVKLNPIILNPSDVVNEVIKTRDYQMILFGNILKLNPDVFSFWHSSERFYPGLNLSLYSNKKVDGLLEAVRKNFDEASRKEQIQQLESLIIEDQPAIFLFSPIYLYVGPKTLGGFPEKILTTPSSRFENINQWYLKTARVFK